MNDYLVTKELYHHGIKGQKWGIRRYQNEDGTLTEAGRKRVTNHLGKIEPAYFTKRGFIKDKTETYTFLRKNNIVTDANYVHTDNNFTTTLKTKLENMNSDGEANRINSISLNNNPLTIDSSKNVNIDLSLDKNNIIEGGKTEKLNIKITYNGKDIIEQPYYEFSIKYVFDEVIL